MKRGDIIARDRTLEIGEVVLHNVSSPEVARSFMEMDFLSKYDCIPTYELKPDELNPGNQVVVLTQAVMKQEKAQVSWVIEGACAVKYEDGNYRIFELVDEPEWKVIVESVPSYQSSVENMTEEDLRKAIDDLRAKRTFITSKPKRVSTRSMVDKNDPMAVALASMSPEKKAELMRKLGMVE